MIDWRVGRLIRPIFHPLILDDTSLVLKQNRQRVAVIVDMLNRDPTQIAGMTIDIDDASVMMIGGNTGFHRVYSITEFGDIPTRQWTLSPATELSSWSVVELIMPEEYLAAGLEQFISEYARWNK